MSSNNRWPSRQRQLDPTLGPDVGYANFDQPGNGGGPQEPRQPLQGPNRGPLAAPEPLYGLAADLANQGPSGQQAGTSAPLPAARPPARLGAVRANRPAVSSQPLLPPPQAPPRAASALPAITRPPPTADPFQLPDAQQQRLPSADGEAPYGLAVELLNQQDPSFQDPAPATDRQRSGRARLGRGRSYQGAGPAVARLGDAGTGAPSMQPPPLDPFTVMELAANHEGPTEPDYGLVAELRNREAPDPFAADFGLAAEVARRRSRSPSPLGRGVGLASGLGVPPLGQEASGGDAFPPLRARRRLEPYLPQHESDSGFGLAEDIAARQRQDAADMAEPFVAAARAGGQDPFALVDEQLKVPKEVMQPYEASQQELPADPVPLKAPGGDAASETSAVNRDDQQYGIADELGADAATGQRQGLDGFGLPLPGQPAQGRAPVAQSHEPPEPPGHKYMYDEDTGMLTSTAGGQGDGGRIVRQYIEDEATGAFYRLHSKRRKLFNLFRRKAPANMEEEDEEEEDKGFRGRLRRTLVGLTNFFNILGMFAQGLLAGYALLNFFMTYMLYGSTNMRKFLSYYAAVAQNNNRIYYSLLVLSVISSTSRLARDKLRNYEPRRLLLAPVGFGQMLLYVAAYVASVLCTPLDDELTYEWNRNPRFYDLTFTSGFKRRLALWHTLNILRTIFSGLAWVLACYQLSPYVFEATLRAELRAHRRQQALMQSLAASGAVSSPDGRTTLKPAK